MPESNTKENIISGWHYALILLVILALGFGFVFGGLAFGLTVNDITITPNQSVMIGNPVSASFSITLTPHDKYTTNPDNTLVLDSSLEKPIWTHTLILESVRGSVIPSEGNTVNIGGWQLAYPLGTSEKINVTLSGIAPNIPSSKSMDVFRISEHDRTGAEIAGATTSIGILVIDPTDISYIVAKEKTDLQNLKRDLEQRKETAKKDIRGSTSAEALYAQAAEGIAYLQTLKPEEYLHAVGRAQEVDRAIRDAEDMLSRESVQDKIDLAVKPINQTAMILAWFGGNKSTANYGGLTNVSDQYNKSISLLNDAEIAMNAKDWAAAGTSATEAYDLGNKTAYDAIALQKRASDPLTPLWGNAWIVFVLGGLVIVGYMLFGGKRKKPGK